MQEIIEKKLKEVEETIATGEIQLKYTEWLIEREEDKDQKDKLIIKQEENEKQHQRNVEQLELFTKFLKEQLEK